MADVWLPGAYRDPGQMAGYSHGRNNMQLVVAHYTVGRDSRGSGRSGYFNFLVHRDASRENGCTQYAEVDALTWHAGGSSAMPDANNRGPGIEWERMTTGGYGPDGLALAEPLTDNQIAWGHDLIDFLASWGIVPTLYDGPRYGAGNGWHGWINHHDIDKDRYDGLTRAEWNLLVGGQIAPPLPPAQEDTMVTIIRNRDTSAQYAFDGMTKRYLPDQDSINIIDAAGLLNPKQAKPGKAPGSGQLPNPYDLLDQQCRKIPYYDGSWDPPPPPARDVGSDPATT